MKALASENIELKQNEEEETAAEKTNETEKETNLDDLRKAFSFSKGLFIMYTLYACTLFPLCLVAIIDIDQEWPPYFDMYPWLFSRLCSAATPVIYPLFHPSIRHGYKTAFDRYVLRKKRLLIAFKPNARQPSKRIMETEL